MYRRILHRKFDASGKVTGRMGRALVCWSIFLLIWVYQPQTIAQKRGLSYGYHTGADLAALAPGVSWWYNWSETPEAAVADVYGDYGFDFVPITCNCAFNETKLRDFLTAHPETKYLLAFNAPNFLEQANMTPKQVATIWPRLEAIADDYQLKIVSPAVNYCGDCVTEDGRTYNDPVQYLDDFFAACPDCRVDYIAVHCYMGDANALAWYISLFQKYNKPIWLTEFSGYDTNGAINTKADQINFMTEAVEFLENEPSVFRYAWFIGRGSGYNNFPYFDLLGARGKLTPLGEAYVNMPTHDTSRVIAIPERIEAENYNRKSGMKLELTSDVDGFAHMKEAKANDYLEYRISVPETGSYNVDIRVSSDARSGLRLYVDGENVVTYRIDDGGSYENWFNQSLSVELTEGEHAIQWKALSSGFHFNWFEISPVSGQKSLSENEMNVFPNPVNDKLILQGNSINQIQIYNPSGTPVLRCENTGEVDLSCLKAGVYLVEFITEQHRYVRKIIKN